jgi:PPOX class probable FMN-dependent enzyme
MQRIEDAESLRQLLGNPHPFTKEKIGSRLDDVSREFIGATPLLFLSTVNVDGRPTVSPKGDAAGFVSIVDEQTLIIPERPGNKLMMGFENILDNGRIGLIFVQPGVEETLRVNGRATLCLDPSLQEQMAANGKPALLLIKVEIEEVFFHCAKAFKRSKAWQPDSWAEGTKVSFGKQIAQAKLGKGMAAKAAAKLIDREVEKDYRKNL